MADQTHYLPRRADLQDSADEETDSLRAQLAAAREEMERLKAHLAVCDSEHILGGAGFDAWVRRAEKAEADLAEARAERDRLRAQAPALTVYRDDIGSWNAAIEAAEKLVHSAPEYDSSRNGFSQDALESATWRPAVLASGGTRETPVKLGGSGKVKKTANLLGDKSSSYLARAIRDQGLPEGFLESAPFTVAGKIKAIGNGVPLPMGRAIARAVKHWQVSSVLQTSVTP